jgi:hypothetical protein
LKWDDIEPYTWIAGLVLFTGSLGYLVIKGHSFKIASIYNKHLVREQDKFYEQDKFDPDGFADLEKELEQAVNERDSQEPVFF